VDPLTLLLFVLAVSLILFFLGVFPLYVENGRLITFARTLDDRRIEQGAFRLLRRVQGKRSGRAVEVDVTPWGQLELRVAAPAQLGSLSICWPFPRRWRDARVVSTFQLVGPEAARDRLAGLLERVPAIDRRLGLALSAAEDLGARELRLEGGWLVARLRRVDLLELQTLLEHLVKLGDALDSLALFNGTVRELYAETRRCPFCHDGLAGETTTCAGCEAAHHTACWSEHGGCSIFGCAGAPREREPAREPGRA
jgi:hypothetical protein